MLRCLARRLRTLGCASRAAPTVFPPLPSTGFHLTHSFNPRDAPVLFVPCLLAPASEASGPTQSLAVTFLSLTSVVHFTRLIHGPPRGCHSTSACKSVSADSAKLQESNLFMFRQCIIVRKVCLLHTSFIFPMCFLHTFCVLSAYFLCASSMFTEHFPVASCMLPAYFLRIFCMFPACFLYASCTLSVCFLHAS